MTLFSRATMRTSSRGHSAYFVWGILQISRGRILFQTFLFPDCFQRIREKIIKVRLRCFCLAAIPVFFVVFLKDAQLFAQRHTMLFMEVSAFTGLNVDNLFSKIGTFTLNVLIDMRYWPNERSRWLDIGQVLFVSVNKNAQKTRPIFGHLDRTSLVNKGFITWRKKRTFTCGTNAGNPERASRVAKQNAGFASSCLLADSRNAGNIFAQLVAQHCCIAGWGNMLRKVDPSSAFCNKLSIL